MSGVDSIFAKFLAVFALALFLFLLLFLVRICVSDARRRGKSPLLVVLLCVLCFPLGSLVWLVFRPNQLERRRAPRIKPADREAQQNELVSPRQAARQEMRPQHAQEPPL